MAFAIGDVFYLAFIWLTSKQWDVLGWKLKHFLNIALLEHGVPRKVVLEYHLNLDQSWNENSVTNKSINNQVFVEKIMKTGEFQKTLDRVVLEIIGDHKNLLRFCEELKDLMSPFIFMIMSLSRVYLIFIVYCFTEVTFLQKLYVLLYYILYKSE